MARCAAARQARGRDAGLRAAAGRAGTARTGGTERVRSDAMGWPSRAGRSHRDRAARRHRSAGPRDDQRCCPAPRAGGTARMIPTPSGVRVWLAVGHSDMRRGMHSLALQVQQTLGRDPYGGDLYVFRGRKADLVKIVWHDGVGMSLYAKRLEKGRFIWPSPADGCVRISGSQLAYMLDGIDWRNPQRTWRPELAG